MGSYCIKVWYDICVGVAPELVEKGGGELRGSV